jgi:hypothetical protein
MREGYMVQILCTHVCNGKMVSVESIPGMVVREIKKNGEGVNSSMIHLIYHKNFCECHNVPPPSTTIKKR